MGIAGSTRTAGSTSTPPPNVVSTIYDVDSANNQLLFDKHEAGRFPSEKEILDKLRAMQ